MQLTPESLPDAEEILKNLSYAMDSRCQASRLEVVLAHYLAGRPIDNWRIDGSTSVELVRTYVSALVFQLRWKVKGGQIRSDWKEDFIRLYGRMVR